MKTFVRDILITVALAAVIFTVLNTSVQRFVVNGPSMNPNFQSGQQLIVNKAVYRFFHSPQRGDVIVFHSPHNNKEEYIKRIIGLPGETIEIKDGKVSIYTTDGDKVPLSEPYITERYARDFQGDVIPEGQYFVMGDNRNNSEDSRYGWTVPADKITGKAWLSIWPPSMWGQAANYPLENQVQAATGP